MIIDHIRDIDEFNKLYNDRPMPVPYDYNFIVNNPCLYCFYDQNNGKLLGFITVQREGGELTLSGVSIRKNMSNIITAIITVCDSFNEDIYSYTPLKHAGLVLKKAGFIETKNNDKPINNLTLKKYVRYKNGK